MTMGTWEDKFGPVEDPEKELEDLRGMFYSVDGEEYQSTTEFLIGTRDNLWDDQHEGGAHKDDLIILNRLIEREGGVPYIKDVSPLDGEYVDNPEEVADLPEDAIADTDEWFRLQEEFENKWWKGEK
jgi:hypothetical protein